MHKRRVKRRSTPSRVLPRAATRPSSRKKRKKVSGAAPPRKKSPVKCSHCSHKLHPKARCTVKRCKCDLRSRASRVDGRGKKLDRSAAAKKGWEKRRKRKALIEAMQDGNWKQIWLPTGDELEEWMQWLAEQLDVDVSEAYQMYFAQGSPPK